MGFACPCDCGAPLPADQFPLSLWRAPAAAHFSGGKHTQASLEAARSLFHHPCQHCIDEHLSRKVLDRCRDPERFLCSSEFECLQATAADITTVNLDLERMQARNRASTSFTRTRSAGRVCVSSALQVWANEHVRLGGRLPNPTATARDLLEAGCSGWQMGWPGGFGPQWSSCNCLNILWSGIAHIERWDRWGSLV